MSYKEQDLSALEAYLKECISPKELSEVLENMLWDYVNYCLISKEYAGNQETANDVWTVKELIAALRGCK